MAMAAGAPVLVAAFAVHAWASSHGHSLGGAEMIAFAALGALAIAWVRR